MTEICTGWRSLVDEQANPLVLMSPAFKWDEINHSATSISFRQSQAAQ
jgi:hypothetical protein